VPDTFNAQLTGLAGYADSNATLAPAAALRRRATRRAWQRRGGAALLGGGAVAVAVTVGLGVTSVGVATTGTAASPRSVAASSPDSVTSPGSAQLTAYQTSVLAKAHVTNDNLAVLKKLHLTPLQIKALAAAYKAVQHMSGRGGDGRKLTVAEIASTLRSQVTVAQVAALGYANMTVGQLEAIAKADLSAAQLAALGG
jgi:hypothetical protein